MMIRTIVATLASVVAVSASAGCSPTADEEPIRPPAATATADANAATPELDTTTEPAEDLTRAAAIFEQEVPKYRFTRLPTGADQPLIDKFKSLFGGVDDVDVAVRRVETDDGGFVPVRMVAVSYTLPEGVPFGALAYEIGREFLDATPENTSDFAGGQGVYMKGMTNGRPSESVAFFIGEDVFVYAFGAGRDSAPTEEVSKALLDANR
ncbi:MAG: hypothetical protein KY391_04955 [Actinobacteria bacterium]|nr:hypothetical protein [Actinomycetota bacterium]